MANGILKDAGLAEDVVQCTFAKWIEKGQDVAPDKLRSWLYSVATNEALAIRRQRRRQGELLRQMPPPHHDLPAEARVLEGETEQQLKTAMKRLSNEQLQVVRMRIYDGKKFIEIAQELDLPLGTVLTRMRLALQRLEKHLKELR